MHCLSHRLYKKRRDSDHVCVVALPEAKYTSHRLIPVFSPRSTICKGR